MDATPWIHALWVAASAHFLVSAVRLLLDRRAAFASFAAAWLIGSIMRDVVIPAAAAIVPALAAVAL